MEKILNVILSIGVRPENILAKKAVLRLGSRGGIVVDSTLKTSDPDIYAIGDAAEAQEFITGLPSMIPLAGPANKQGRVAADNALGRKSIFKGSLGTAIAKIFDLAVASTVLNGKLLKQRNTPYISRHTHSYSHASYYPRASQMSIKLLFSPNDGKILGAQIIGQEGVDKRIDVIATAIYARMTVFDLEELGLAYGSAKNPVNIVGFAAANIIKEDTEICYPDQIAELGKKSILIYVRNRSELEKNGSIEGAQNIPLDYLRKHLPKLDKDKNYKIFCAIGLRGYLAYRILTQNGFKAQTLSGGFKTFKKHGI